MPLFLTILIATILSSIGGLIGGFVLLWKEAFARRASGFFLSIAVGGLLGAAFFDVLPEALDHMPTQRALSLTLAGFFVFFLFEKFFHHHHNERGVTGDHRNVTSLVIFGDGLHNFVDGLTIAATYMANPAVGTVTAIAVWLHEIPQEIGDFSILLHTGVSRRRVGLFNFLGALVSPLGAIVGYFAVQHVQALAQPLVAFAAGNFLYLSGAYIIPELHKEAHWKQNVVQIVTILAAIIGMAWLDKLLNV